MSKRRKRKALLIGVGLDSDGHTRITNGENYRLVGGKKETHECLQEIAAKTEEKIQKTGKSMEELPLKQIRDTLQDVLDSVKK